MALCGTTEPDQSTGPQHDPPEQIRGAATFLLAQRNKKLRREEATAAAAACGGGGGTTMALSRVLSPVALGQIQAPILELQ